MMAGFYEFAPKYIPVDLISRTALNYQWDSESPFSIIKAGSIARKAELRKIANRGLVAYSIGCAEWVVYRLSQAIDMSLPCDYLEALWSYVTGHHEIFQFPPELDHEEWMSKALSPVDCAISSVMNIIYLSEYYDPPIEDVARISELVRHILENCTAFDAWEIVVLDRLQRFCPINSTDPAGAIISRVLLDPCLVCEDVFDAGLMGSELSGYDFSGNRFYIPSDG